MSLTSSTDELEVQSPAVGIVSRAMRKACRDQRMARALDVSKLESLTSGIPFLQPLYFGSFRLYGPMYE